MPTPADVAVRDVIAAILRDKPIYMDINHVGLFEGYGGTTRAAEMAIGPLRTLWYCDIKPASVALLAHRYPGVPNVGDFAALFPMIGPLTAHAIDLAAQARGAVVTVSWPCQPHSSAGLRLGAEDPRALWPNVARFIAEARPAIVLGENVARVASNGELRRVVRSLADRGYVGSWRCVRASDVGAPHRRDRCFVVAVDATSPDAVGLLVRDESGRGGGPDGPGAGVSRHDGEAGPAGVTPRPTPTRRDHKGPGLRDGARSDGARRSDAQLDLPAVVERLLPTPTTLLKTPTSNLGSNGGSQHPDKRKAGGHGPTLADEVEWTMPAALLPTPSASTYGTNQGGAAGRVGPVRESLDTMARNGRFDDALLPTPRATDGKHGRPGMSTSSGSPALPALAVEYAERWGIYAAAVARWETLTRPAPAPTVTSPRNGRPQLSPAFVEWMMGLPAGWVTDVAVTPKASSVRNAHLSLLGDGVVPQQAAYAFRLMLDELAHLVAVERAA